MFGTIKLILLFAVFVIVTAYEPSAHVENAVDDDSSEDNLRSLDPALLQDDDISDDDAAALLARLTSENTLDDAPSGRLEKRGWRRRWRRVKRFLRRAARVVATIKVASTVLGKKR